MRLRWIVNVRNGVRDLLCWITFQQMDWPGRRALLDWELNSRKRFTAQPLCFTPDNPGGEPKMG